MIINIYDLKKHLGIAGASRMQQKLRAVIEPIRIQMRVPRMLKDGTKQMAFVWLDHYDLDKTVAKSEDKEKLCHHRWVTRFKHRTKELKALKKLIQEAQGTV